MTNALRRIVTITAGFALNVTGSGFRFDRSWRHAEPGRTDCGRCPALKWFVFRYLVSTVGVNDIADRGWAAVPLWAR
jgi:hypothetical protein